MRSGIPWSVKGIEPEAREAAKQAARRSGLTLGAWLNQVIMDSGTDEVTSEESALDRDLISLGSGNEAASLRDAAPDASDQVRHVADRLSQSERRTAELAQKLEQSLNQIAQRIEAVTQAAPEEPREPDPAILAPIERKLAQLAEKLEASERQRLAQQSTRRPDDKAIATLERSVSAVVDHLEASEKRHEESLEDIRHALGQLQNRFAEAEEASAREEAEARSREFQSNLNTLASRLERMEHSFSGIGSTLERTQSQAVDAALKAIAERADADGQKSIVHQLQQNLGLLTQRLVKAEERSDETLRQFERSMESVAKRLESIDKPKSDVTPAVVKAVESRLEQMAQRLDKNEKLTVEAAQALEKAIAGISQSLQTSEGRSRQTVETLQQLMQRMADKIARVEKQTKAVQASSLLSPQIGVGPGHNGGPGMGFMPTGEGFPAPNFDAAPVMGGAGFGAPALRQDFRSPLAEPMAPWTPPAPEPKVAPRAAAPAPFVDAAPPPFAEPEATDEADDVAFSEAEPNVSEAQVQGAHDFLAAARRAAQMAASNGQSGPYFGAGAQSPYVDAAARLGAYGRDDEDRPSKRLIAAAAAMVVIALGVGSYFALSQNNALPQNPLVTPPVESTLPKTAPEAVAEKAPENPPAITPLPEATPEVAGVTDVTPVTPVEPPAKVTPSPKPVAKPTATGKPKATDAGMGTLTPGPTLTPHPAKPVETAPLANAKPDLETAAASGNAAAAYQMGLNLANGAGPSDMAKAASWYRKAAEQGMAAAQYRLAALYEKGRGVAQDNKAALTWYEKAAQGGNVKAMHNLAVIHAEGRGTKQDFAGAAKWFAAAADFGLGDSQYNLAILNERGLGVDANPVEAYKWFAVAAKGGDAGAAKKRDELAARLEPSALAQAKVAAETFRPRRPEAVANGDISGLTSWK